MTIINSVSIDQVKIFPHGSHVNIVVVPESC